MSALQDAAFTAQLRAAFPDVDLSRLRAVLATYFWRWYVLHQLDVLAKRKILVFSVTLKVRDLFALFVLLFGPNPIPRAGE